MWELRTQIRWSNETKPSTRLKEHHRDTLPKYILKNPEKTALTKHAAQSGHAFNWDCAHVLRIYIMQIVTINAFF